MGGIEDYLVSMLCAADEKAIAEVTFNKVPDIDLVQFEHLAFTDDFNCVLSASKIASLYEIKAFNHANKITKYFNYYGGMVDFCMKTGATMTKLINKLNSIRTDPANPVGKWCSESFGKDGAIEVPCILFNAFYHHDYDTFTRLVEEGRSNQPDRYTDFLPPDFRKDEPFHWVEQAFHKVFNRDDLYYVEKKKKDTAERVLDIKLRFKQIEHMNLLLRDQDGIFPTFTAKLDERRQPIKFFASLTVSCLIFSHREPGERSILD